MAQNEKTSERVASIASKVLNMAKPTIVTNELWEDIKTLAASALTQAPDKLKSDLAETSLAAKWASLSRLKGLDALPSVGTGNKLFQALMNSDKKKP